MSFWYLLISLVASIIGAISGIGGGIIIKPFLDAINLFSLSTINFLSGCTVLAMTTMSMLLTRRNSTPMNFRVSSFLGIGAAIGGIAGKELFEFAIESSGNHTAISIIQSAMIVLITITVFFFVRYKSSITTRHIQNTFVVFLLGFSLGVTSAFLGIGGGPLNIALLNYFFSMDGKAAVINSLYIIFIAQLFSVVSILVSNSIPPFDMDVLILMVTGGLIGAFIGRKLNHKMSNRHVDSFFCILLICIALLSIWNIFRFFI